MIEALHSSGQPRSARNLRLRGRRWWARFYVRGRRFEKSLEADSLKVARERLQFLMALHAAGHSIFPEDILANVALAKWEASLLARRTVKSARTDIARVRRFFETAQVSSLGKVSPGWSGSSSRSSGPRVCHRKPVSSTETLSMDSTALPWSFWAMARPTPSGQTPPRESGRSGFRRPVLSI